MSKFTKYRDKATGAAKQIITGVGLSAVGVPGAETTATVGAAADVLTPDLQEPEVLALPDVPGPQGVPIRDQTTNQYLAQGVQPTGSEDLPGTGLFGPKKKAASRALIGY